MRPQLPMSNESYIPTYRYDEYNFHLENFHVIPHINFNISLKYFRKMNTSYDGICRTAPNLLHTSLNFSGNAENKERIAGSKFDYSSTTWLYYFSLDILIIEYYFHVLDIFRLSSKCVSNRHKITQIINTYIIQPAIIGWSLIKHIKSLNCIAVNN